ncbi:MAG TPA: sn-glycerol-3-phosphate ABC transporter ATP-binding protein UgpC [Streptosporangiaceae bacterium]|nr:sn-glycerol-3-phosphate ABC transporter ATP-binding protein UgpC [Streptosporangiaceae bacterium]
MSAITLENLTKVYSTGAKAVDGLDLDVADGEFVVLVGPSGCGKTTTLRMVAGLETITAGSVRFGDRVVNAVPPRQRDVAMVFQNYALYPHLTVAENIGFTLANKKVPRAERDRRVGSVAEVLGLSALLNRKPGQLSGGQRQRVAMGRAIVREPSVFLMDEPLSNLDAKLRVRMRSEVLRVHRQIRAATLYVTHDQVEAVTMGDRVAVLDGGILQQYGRPRDLYDRPANLFVAEFIGSPGMNLYEASVSDGELVLGSQRLPLGPAVTALVPYQGRKVVAGVRPEDLSPGAVRQGTDCRERTATLVADILAVELLGSDLQAYFAIDAQAVSANGNAAVAGESSLLPARAHDGVARLDPLSGVRSGERIAFGVEPSRLHYFDPDTGQAIR